jgi:GNAT superfamily N-acetyltransferase
MIADLPLGAGAVPDPEDWTDAGDLRQVGEINDRAYGLAGNFAAALTAPSAPGVHAYVAHHDGAAAACAVTYDRDGDCGVYMVATLPEARGRGLAGGLMTRALADAAERGCATSTLQATAAGAPLYARLGYRDLGAVQMWERRGPEPGS